MIELYYCSVSWSLSMRINFLSKYHCSTAFQVKHCRMYCFNYSNHFMILSCQHYLFIFATVDFSRYLRTIFYSKENLADHSLWMTHYKAIYFEQLHCCLEFTTIIVHIIISRTLFVFSCLYLFSQMYSFELNSFRSLEDSGSCPQYFANYTSDFN